jgi:hypothetical protein
VFNAVPGATPVTRPAALTVATPVAEELYVAVDVSVTCDESDFTPVTVSWSVAPMATVGLAANKLTDTTWAEVEPRHPVKPTARLAKIVADTTDFQVIVALAPE